MIEIRGFLIKTTNKLFQIAGLLVIGSTMVACTRAQETSSLRATPIILNTNNPNLVRATTRLSLTPVQPTNTPAPRLTITLTRPPSPTQTTTRSSPSPTLTATPTPPVSLSSVLYPGWISFTNANYIKTMLIAQNGDIWTAGEGGLVHWDVNTGTYVKYTPEHGVADVDAIAQGPNGVLWFGTYGHGLLGYDGNQWKRHTTQDGLPGDFVYSVVVAQDDNIWLATDKGIARYDGQSWTFYLTTTTQAPLSEIWELAVAPDGTLWGFGYHVIYFDGKNWIETVERPEGLGYLIGIAFTSDSTIWIAGMDGIAHYDGQNWGTVYSPWKTLTKASVSALASAPDGSLWIGLSVDCIIQFDCTGPGPGPDQEVRKTIPGVYRFDGMNWKAFNTQDGLVDNEVCSIMADSDGSLWFGSCRLGISRFDGLHWTTYQTKDEPPANFIGRMDASGSDNVWVAPWRQPWGVAHYDGKEWESYINIEDWVNAIYISSDGEVWFGTINSLVRFDGNTWDNYHLDKDGFPVSFYAITELPDHTYLIGSSSGAYIFDEQRWAITKDFEGLRGDSVECLLVHPDQSLWFGVSGQGISVYRNQAWRQYTLSDGLPSVDITSIGVQPDGTVWIAARDGVARFNGTRWVKYTKDFGGINVTSLVVDGDGIVWVGTDRGLYKFDGQAWSNYTLQDGLDIIYDLASDFRGTIWIATRIGLYKFFPPEP